MTRAPDLEDVDGTMLTSLVRQALNDPAAEIQQWRHEPVSYINTEELNLGLHRFKGIAEEQGRARPWSIILKAVKAPLDDSDPTRWNYHRREILAYRSGLLSDLPGGLSAPGCLGIHEYDEGVYWLWLEDVQDSASQPWSLAEYRLAARHLGRFNGAYASGHPLPVMPWLSRQWLRGWLTEYDRGCRNTVDLIQDPNIWKHPLLLSSFPTSITDEVLRMWENHEALLSVLDGLPKTFCHMDAYRPNLFLRRDTQGMIRTVAIDWAFAGIGSLGEEIANLWAASLMWFEYDATDARGLDEAVFAGYLDGLRDTGWQEDVRLIRLGYTSACVLRWGVIGLWWMLSLNNPQELADFEHNWKHPMPDLVLQWAKTAYSILDLANEAYELKRELLR